MTDTEKYNGWTNWETWNAYTILTSYDDIYFSIINFIKEEKIKKRDSFDVKYNTENFLKDLILQLKEENNLDFGSEWRINLSELAEAFIQDRNKI